MIGQIKEVHIVLENCDLYKIPIENIIGIVCRDIYKDIGINSFGQVWELNKCKHFDMTLKKDNYLTEWQKQEVETIKNFDFERRMLYNDITSISCILMDGTEYDVCVPFDDENYILNIFDMWPKNNLQKFEIEDNYYEITISEKFREK